MENAGNATMLLQIPRICLKQPTEETNVFSLSLPENQTYCPVKWVPLDPCRKYKIEIKSEYSNIWTRAPSLWETFTEERGNDVIISKLYTSVTLFNIHSILSIHPNESCTKSTWLPKWWIRLRWFMSITLQFGLQWSSWLWSGKWWTVLSKIWCMLTIFFKFILISHWKVVLYWPPSDFIMM
jgi:hypothetical protein